MHLTRYHDFYCMNSIRFVDIQYNISIISITDKSYHFYRNNSATDTFAYNIILRARHKIAPFEYMDFTETIFV